MKSLLRVTSFLYDFLPVIQIAYVSGTFLSKAPNLLALILGVLFMILTIMTALSYSVNLNDFIENRIKPIYINSNVDNRGVFKLVAFASVGIAALVAGLFWAISLDWVQSLIVFVVMSSTFILNDIIGSFAAKLIKKIEEKSVDKSENM